MKSKLKFAALAIVAALTCTMAMAMAQGEGKAEQAAQAEQDRADAEAALKASGPFLKDMPVEERQRAVDLGRSVVTDLLGAYEQRMKTDKSLTEQGNKARQFADSIADEALQADRDKALDFLGIDPKGTAGLYIFVTWSMPLEMLRSYVLDGMWSGATIVFKGVPPDKTLGDFVLKDLQKLVYGKSAAANISIDPRMFDAYEITTAPTIVYTTNRGDMTCQGVGRVPFKYGDQTLEYDSCPPLAESTYWKISGAVSTNYALESFKEAKAPGVDAHLKALARGFAEGKAPSKEQLEFKGKWESVLSPEEAELARQVSRDTGQLKEQYAPKQSDAGQSRQGSKLPFAPDDPLKYRKEIKEPTSPTELPATSH